MKITRHQDLEVYKKAFTAAMRLFELSESFPKEETYSLTDQFADVLALYARISPKLGAGDATKQRL